MPLKKLMVVIILALIINSSVVFGSDLTIAKKIEINIPERKLTLYSNNKIVKNYPVAVGKSNSQTPVGNFSVINKVVNPYYKKANIPGGSERNPLGNRWIGFKPHYGIHGNSNPSSIGTFASAGCVRMYERDVKEIYNLVSLNTPVTVKYELFHILNDIEGKDPILVVYPDYYNKVKNMNKKIDEMLDKIELNNKLTKEKINKLKKLVNEKVTVFSDKWTFFINGKYITKDIIVRDNKFYINKDKISKFFNIKIPSLESGVEGFFMGNSILQVENEGKKYILIDDLKKFLGGKINIDYEINKINYSTEYILLNNRLLKGKIRDLRTDPKISLSAICKFLDINIRIENNKLKLVKNNGKEIKYIIYNNEPYISIKLLEKEFGIKSDIFTLNKHVKLYKDPEIIFKNTIYKGKLIDNEIYIPYRIFFKDKITKKTILKPVIIFDFKRIAMKDIDGELYVKLSDIKKYLRIEKDPYNLKLYIEKREFK
ncbi:L,D-transpeptidase [Thermohalobacter berrensis]|uniref:L,D-TPase catalytic domain-containing protein n=1 Tax=Thermohalobacter berrensis TaxID=99594 RepID=A0A419T6D1_9FIRM|nr:L,D-transpeptidase [Thermohalobacter berrensis]RKD33167.1 hypothetical protein BET03_09625 [Thermohalobacter berrensis]